MRLPQDMTNLLAVAIRDVIWFKDSVLSFLAECGVPESIMISARRMRREPSIKIVKMVLEELAGRGNEGALAARAMLTKMHYWKDLHSVPPDRRDQAAASLKELQKAYKLHLAQMEHEQKKREEGMQEARHRRVRMSDLDHGKLQGFRDAFDHVHGITEARERGDAFEALMNEIFGYYCDESRGPFRRTGEQVDGLFYFDKHWYYVEIRWRAEKANAADVSVLRDRAKAAYGGDTKALFVSFNGFSEECLASLKGKSDERVILMDGYDLRCVLDCQIAFDVLIAEKQAAILRDQRAFVGVAEIMATTKVRS